MSEKERRRQEELAKIKARWVAGKKAARQEQIDAWLKAEADREKWDWNRKRNQFSERLARDRD